MQRLFSNIAASLDAEGAVTEREEEGERTEVVTL